MTDQPTTTAASGPEPMSEERIAKMRAVIARDWPDGAWRNAVVDGWEDCLDEIERQRAVIAEQEAEIRQLEIENSLLCEDLNMIEVEVSDDETDLIDIAGLCNLPTEDEYEGRR